MTLRRALTRAAACGLMFLTVPAWGQPDNITDGLRWRLVGPLRAGWGTAVTGVPGQLDTFYFGAAGGGVWKTTDAGQDLDPDLRSRSRRDRRVRGRAVRPARDLRRHRAGHDALRRRGRRRACSARTTAAHSWQSVGAREVAPHRRDPTSIRAMPTSCSWRRSATSSDAMRSAALYRSARTAAGPGSGRLFVSDATGAVDLAADPAAIPTSSTPPRGRCATGRGSVTSRPTDRTGERHLQVARRRTHLDAADRQGTARRRRSAASASPRRTRGAGTRVYAASRPKSDGGLYRSDDAGASWSCVNDERDSVNELLRAHDA